VCQYNCHSADYLDWPFAMLKQKYIFHIKYTEAIFIKQHSETEITKMLTAVEKIHLLCHF